MKQSAMSVQPNPRWAETEKIVERVYTVTTTADVEGIIGDTLVGSDFRIPNEHVTKIVSRTVVEYTAERVKDPK